VAARRITQHSAGIRRPPVAIETLHELRADASEKEAGQRHSRHLTLDDEAEAGGQGRREHEPVQIARMIGHYHTLTGREPLQSADGERHAGHHQKGA